MRRELFAALLFLSACTGGEDPDGGTDARTSDPDAHVVRADASQPDAAPRDASSGTDAGPSDAGAPIVLDGCSQGAPAIPAEARWAAYFDADVELVADGTGQGGAASIEVHAWRSRVGSAVLRVPSSATPPLLELNGWTRRTSCTDCLASIRFRTSASRNDVLRDESGVLSNVLASPAFTLLVQLDHPSSGAGRIGWSDPSDGTPRLRVDSRSTDVRLAGASAIGAASAWDDPRVVAIVRDAAGLRVHRATATGALRAIDVDATAVLAATAGRFGVGELGAATSTDLRLRRLAISREAFTPAELDAVWSAWRARDEALRGSPALRYQNVVAEHGPIALWRLGAELYPQLAPAGYRVTGTPMPEAQPCATSFSEQYDASSDVLTGGFVEVPDSPAYTIPTSGRGLSVELWVHFDELDPTGEPGASGRKDYIHWLGKGQRSNYEWAFRLYRSDSATRPSRLSFYAWDLEGGEGPGDYFMAGTDRIRDRWLHIVGIADDPSTPGAQLTIYVDGIRGNSGPASLFTHETYGATPGDGTAPVRLGTRTENGFLTGQLADVAIYPRALSGAEVLSHYEAGHDWRNPE